MKRKRCAWLIVLFLAVLRSESMAAVKTVKPFHIHAMALESLFFTPPNKNDIKKWGKEVYMTSPQLEALFRIARNPGPTARRFNDMKGARILLIDTRSNAEIYLTQNKAAVFQNRELPISAAAVDQLVDQIKRAPWYRRP